MEPNKIFLSIGILATLLNIIVVKADGQERFVRQKMANYSTWLKANNYDPSPIVFGLSYLHVYDRESAIEMEGFLRVSGYSDDIGVHYLGYQLLRRFNVSLKMTGNITFYGDYTLSGTIDPDRKPISAAGSWHIKIPGVNAGNFRIVCEVNEIGYAVISSHSSQYVEFDIGLETEREMCFENLLEQDAAIGNEKAIERAVLESFHRYLYIDRDEEHPIRHLHIKYWDEIFEGLRWEDIVGSK